MTVLILGEAALRTLVLGALVVTGLRLLRVRQPGPEILALQALLAGAWLMPLLMRWSWFPLPALSELGGRLFPGGRPWPLAPFAGAASAPGLTIGAPLRIEGTRLESATATGFTGLLGDPLTLLMGLYLLVAAIMVLRLLVGLGLAWRVTRRGRPLGSIDGVAVRVSAELDLPVTVGALVVVPEAWHGWDDERRRAILLHEGEHVRQGDFWWQLAAGLYRALFWFNPLGWWLARSLRDLAERRSDDRVVAHTIDRADYAGLLLEFGARASRLSPGVAMARPGSLVRRIERILEGEETMIRMTWKTRALILAALAAAVAVCAGGASVARDRAAARSTGAGQTLGTTAGAAAGGDTYGYSTDTESDDAYVYVHGANATMSGDTGDLKRARALQKQMNGDYIWFLRGREALVVTDPLILERFNAIFAPQEGFSAQQDRLSEWQDRLSAWQDRLTATLERITEAQADHPGSAAVSAGSIEEISAQMAEVARLQGEVGEEQAKLGQTESRFTIESTAQVRALLDEARAGGLARPAH